MEESGQERTSEWERETGKTENENEMAFKEDRERPFILVCSL